MVILSILVVSCIETNYPEEAIGNFIVHNDASSGKTITRIVVTTDWLAFGDPDTMLSENISIVSGGSSKKYGIDLKHSDYIGNWNGFRITITLNDNSSAFLRVKLYDDIDCVLRYNGTALVQE